MTTRPRSSSLFVFVTVLLDTLGIGLIIPIAPRLVASFLQDDLRSASRWLGVLFAIYSVMQFAFAPVLGGLSDRFGRRAVRCEGVAWNDAKTARSRLAHENRSGPPVAHRQPDVEAQRI